MEDLISRHRIIEFIEQESRAWGDEYGVSDVLRDIADFGEPETAERTEERIQNVSDSDLISRKAVIDVLDQLQNNDLAGDETIGTLQAAKSIIDYSLPSGEPKQNCNSCRYNSKEWHEEPCDSCTMGGEDNHWESAQPTGNCAECDYMRDPTIAECKAILERAGYVIVPSEQPESKEST